MPYTLSRALTSIALIILSHLSVLAFTDQSSSSPLADASRAKESAVEAGNVEVEITPDGIPSSISNGGGAATRAARHEDIDSSRANELEHREPMNKYRESSSSTNEHSEGIINALKRQSKTEINSTTRPRRTGQRTGTIWSRALKTAQMTAIFVAFASICMLYCKWKYKDAPVDSDQNGNLPPIRR
jgi:hypothetical protein